MSKPLQLPPTQRDKISAADLYTVLNDVSRYSCHIYDPLYLLLLDTRSVQDYQTNHIQSAFHVSAVNVAIINQNLQKFSNIIFYGADGKLDENDQFVEHAVGLLEDHDIDYDILTGGFREFHERFPFMCNTVTAWTEVEREHKLSVYPSLILEDWLYQGNGNQARNAEMIQAMGITHILNISTEHKCDLEGVKYMHIKLQDEGSSPLIDHFENVFEFLDEAKRTKGRALVHCNLGVSRSSTASLAYMMLSERCSLGDAYTFLKQRRPISAPNRGFLLQLGEFEEYVFGKSLTDANELWLSI